MPRVPFNDSEEREFERSFEKQFVDHQDDSEVVTLYLENKDLIKEFGEFMKDELGRQFGGQYAASDEFGMTEFRPWFIGDPNWLEKDVPTYSGGEEREVINFIDQGAGFHLDGSTGKDYPIKIGNPVGHLIIGYRSIKRALADEVEDPDIYCAKFWKNENPHNVWWMENRLRGSQRSIYQPDKPIRVVPGDTIACELYGDPESDGYDIPALYGVSFIQAEYLRADDPRDYIGENMEYPTVVPSSAIL